MIWTNFTKFLAILIVQQLITLKKVESFECNQLIRVKIQCKKMYETEWLIGKVSVCEDDSLLTINRLDVEIGEVSQGNSVVVDALHLARGQNISFLPFGIAKSFKKLRALKISNSRIDYLSKWNLKQFGEDLAYVEFYKSSIVVLNADLFKFNPNLEFITFAQNPLKHIDEKMFENLRNFTKLKRVILTECGCINQKIENFDLKFFTLKGEKCQDVKTSSEVLAKHLQMILAQKFRRIGGKCTDELDEKFDDIKKEIQKYSTKTIETSRILTSVIDSTKTSKMEIGEKFQQLNKTLADMKITLNTNMEKLKKSIPEMIEDEIEKNKENMIRGIKRR